MDQALPGRIEELVDHLRVNKDPDLSLSDIASVTEVLIATMQAFFKSIDTSIYRECRSLSEYIGNARLEIAALTPHDLEKSRLPRAGLELDAIVEQTEEATNTIMTSAEEIMAALGADNFEEHRDKVQDAIMNIFEACSFQDITGQRISKVVHTLDHIEKRVKDLRDLMGVTDEHLEAARKSEELESEAKSDPLAQGPSLKGEGIDQSEVDALMSAGDATKSEAEASDAEESEAKEEAQAEGGVEAQDGTPSENGDDSEKKEKEGGSETTTQADIDALFS